MKLTEQKITIAYVKNKITLLEALKVYREINLRKGLRKDSDKEKREK